MRDILEAVAKAVCEVVSGENLPFWSADVLLLVFGDSVGGEIPHLGVGVCDVLLHAQESSLRRVFAVTHVLEFLNVCFHILLGVLAAVSRAFLAFLSTSLELDFFFVAVADVGSVFLDEFYSQVVKLLEVVTGVCDFIGGEALSWLVMLGPE